MEVSNGSLRCLQKVDDGDGKETLLTPKDKKEF